jgi:hypothetical protein
MTLKHALEPAESAQPPTARELAVDARIDRARSDAVLLAAEGHWVGACSLGNLVVVVSGPGAPPSSPMELRTFDRHELGL